MSIEEDQAAINRRQKIAEMLMAQGSQPIEQQEAGGYVVPISPMAGIAKVAQQLAGAYVGKKADERQSELYKQRQEGADIATQEYLSGEDRKAAAIRAISNELTPKELKAAAASEYTQLNKPEGRKGVPSGFVANADGSIKPMPVEGYGDYAAFQLAQAGAKAQTPSYGEPERLQMAQEDQQMQRSAMARAEEAAALQQAKFEEEKRAREKAEAAPLKLSATEQKSVIENDDLHQKANSAIGLINEALELNKKKTYSGYGAVDRATFRSNLPLESEEASNTINLDNIIRTQALEQLKAIFGGMPTEGERKVLLELQASADKTPQDREKILKRALSVIDEKSKFYKERADKLRSGTYFTSQQPVINISPENDTPEVRAAIAADIEKDKNKGFSDEDLQHTAQKHGITVDEVKKRLGVK